MKLGKDILIEALAKKRIRVVFENLQSENPYEIVEQVCSKTILRIQRVLNNAEINDYECIEKIVRLLEGIGVNSGSRHDWG